MKVPALLMDMEEVQISRWLVEEGQAVQKGDPVLEIETDKSSFEIEAPADGEMRGLRGAPGETMAVGATLAFVAEPGEEIPEAGAETEPEGEPEATTAVPVVDDGGGSAAPQTDTPRPETEAASPNGRKLRASPAARKAAAEMGVSLEALSGSGPYGRIYLTDVIAASQGAPEAEAPATEAPAPAQATPEAASGVAASGAGAAAQEPSVRRETMSRARRVGGARTAQSFSEVPHFYLTRDLDADRLLELRERLKAKMDPAPSVTDLLVLAVARTLKDHPRLNARFVGDGEMEVHDGVNVGLAVATDAGLMVPVLQGADALALKDIVARSREMIGRTREGKMRAEELSGGTFTISNLGMMEIDHFNAIINAPEAGILAVGRARTIPEWDGNSWVPKRVFSVTLSVDHRVADGADGARFLAGLQAAISDWELLL